MDPEKLILEAVKAQKNAKAQYSNYPVGAALLTSDDTIIHGCNVESKAYPTTLCAERIAIFSAIAQGFSKFKALAIVTNDGGMPCGGCRQIMVEYLENIPVFVGNTSNDSIQTFTIEELLPHPFGK